MPKNDDVVTPERLKERVRQMERTCGEIVARARKLAEEYEEAYEYGHMPSGRGGFVATHGSGRGDDADPTGDTVASWDHRRIRKAVRTIAKMIGRAERELLMADQELLDAFLDTDPDLKADRLARRAAAYEIANEKGAARVDSRR